MKKCVIERLQLHILTLAVAVFLTSCGSISDVPSHQETIETGFKVSKAGTYDSADSHAVVCSIDEKEQTITFFNRVVGRKYTLQYDGTSKLYDKYGSSIVLEQIEIGDIVDVTFLKERKRLNTLSISSDVWEYSEISSFEINEGTKEILFGNNTYKYNPDKLFVFANGQKAGIIDLNACDVLTFKGLDHEVFSISVDTGHGYIRLTGEESFVDGWVEIGKIIKPVTKNMLITVPEGKYDLIISKGNQKGTIPVEVNTDKETQVDVSGFAIVDETQYGKLIFATTPQDAEVYMDGEEVDTSKPFEIEYGIHQLMARAEGYETITQYIKVGQANATLDVTLEKVISATPAISPEVPRISPTPQITAAVTPQVEVADTSDYKVTIESPEGVEVYVDGNYIGIAPASFKKTQGTHVVTLRKEGYTTRSYTISLDGLLQNETFSFSALSEEVKKE